MKIVRRAVGAGSVEVPTPTASAGFGYLRVVSLRKSFRARVIALVSMALLFTQVALAAYACPAIAGASGETADAMAGMPCAEMMAAGSSLDPAQPSLCAEHCKLGSAKQPSEPLQPLGVLAVPLATVLRMPADPAGEARLASRAEDDRLRSRPPPLAHSVAHCCYRI